jgi:hypothetical protein
VISDEQKQNVLAQMRQLSAADFSVLNAAVQALDEQDSVRVTTTPDSANDRLWSQFAALGMMSLDPPLDVPVGNRLFVIYAAAKEQLRELVETVQRDALPGIFNRLRRDVPEMIVPPVLAACGRPADVSLMLAGIIEGTMRRYIKDELHAPLLDDIVMKVRMLKKQL